MRLGRTLEFRILGPLEVELDGKRLNLGPQKRRLLAVLLMSLLGPDPGASISPEKLCLRAWDLAVAEKRTPGLVREHIHQLRRQLDPDWGSDNENAVIQARYRLEVPRPLIDAYRFRVLRDEGKAAWAAGDARLAESRLRSALELWRGAPFEGADLRDEEGRAAEFERQLGAEHQAALELLADARRTLSETRIPPLQMIVPPPSRARATGRETELARVINCLLDGWDRRGAGPRCQLNGIADVGKTSIALIAAGRLAGWFPDGIIFVSLHGTRQPPKSPADAQADIFRGLGLQVPGDDSVLTGVLRKALEGRRMLVIADGAADAGQVRPLLEACEGCAALVTSREPLAIEGLRSIMVDPFRPEPAARYLHVALASVGWAAGEDTADILVRIAEASSRLPRHLDLIADDFARNPRRSLADWTEDLNRKPAQSARDEPPRVVDGARVRARPMLQDPLQAAYEALNEGARRAFRLLSLVNSPTVAAWTVASLLDCGLEEAERVLDGLVSARLLQRMPGRPPRRERYYVHDRIHTLMTRLGAQDPGRSAALDRCLQSHLWMARRARATLDPDVPPPSWQPAWVAASRRPIAPIDDPMAWFADEHSAMIEAVRSAHRSQYRDLTWQITRELVPFLEITGRGDAWEETHRLALEATWDLAGEAGATTFDSEGQAWTLCGRGLLRRYQGRPDAAIDSFMQARALFTARGDRYGEAVARCGHADILLGTGQFDPAITELTEALLAFTGLGMDGGRTSAMAGLGEAHARRAQTVMRRYGQSGNSKMEPGVADTVRADLEQAIRWSGESVELTAGRDRRRWVSSLRDLGVACRSRWELDGDQADLEDAAAAFHKCAAEYDRQGDRHGYARTLVSDGLLRQARGLPQEARQCYHEAIGVFGVLNDRWWNAQANQRLGDSWLAAGDAARAAECYGKAVTSLRETEYRDELAHALLQSDNANRLAGNL
jgi:tetratricopeptide (TPR) repeat protein